MLSITIVAVDIQEFANHLIVRAWWTLNSFANYIGVVGFHSNKQSFKNPIIKFREMISQLVGLFFLCIGTYSISVSVSFVFGIKLIIA